MKKMMIYEPAMCCPTGLCGVGVDPELLRISAVLNNLKNNGVVVERYNLTSAPQEFVKNDEVNKLLMKNGNDILPIVVVDGKIVITKRYPKNEEFVSLLEVPKKFIGEVPEVKPKKVGGCGCNGSCC